MDENLEKQEEEQSEELSAAELAYLASKGQEEEKKGKSKSRGSSKILHEMASDSDMPRSNMSLLKILGGDILQSEWLRRQIPLLVMLMVLVIIYIGNRYASQQEMIEIDDLKQQLTDVKYDALTRSSELLERTRRSKIEQYLKNSNDSALKTAIMPPYVIETN